MKHVCLWRDVKTLEVCGKLFVSPSKLHRHVRAVHEKARDYVCEWKDPASGAVCGKSFTQRGGLTTHIRTVHEKDRPFVCEWKDPTTGAACGKSYGQSSHLSTHMKSAGHHSPPCHPDDDMLPSVSECQSVSDSPSPSPSSDHVDMVELLSNPGPSKLWEYVDDWDNPVMGEESCWREVQ